MISCDRSLVYRWHIYEQAHLGEFGMLCNKAAVQPSARAGESGDNKRAIKR